MPQKREVIGWRELVGLPDIGIPKLAAKIDTGAKTSALHAEDQEIFERNGQQWVRFKTPANRQHPEHLVEAPVKTLREIKNTSGIPELRIVIRTLMLLGKHRWHIDVSLADREAMIFDLIIGRRALRGRKILVDPAHSFLSDLGQSPLSRKDEMRNPGGQPIERMFP